MKSPSIKNISNITPDFFYYYITENETFDIIPIECGKEYCSADKEILNKKYNYYAFHCVINGKGYYKIRGTTYTVEKNMIFCFFPGEQITYYPDKDDPWEYIWINFMGVKAKDFVNQCKFSVYAPVYSFQNAEIPLIFQKMIDKSNLHTRDLFTLSYVYEILSNIIEERHTEDIYKGILESENYVNLALNFISDNLSNPDLSLKMLSKKLNLSEGYLSKMIKNTLGRTFVDYVTRMRIAKACYYLEHTDYLNKEIAFLVGYNDPLYFSKKFRAITGLTSFEYREIHKK